MEDQVTFWTKLSAIGQLAGAIATFAAVVVSLWIALTERLPKLKLAANLSVIFAPGDFAIDVISFEVTNVGQQLVHVSSIGWRTGWLRRGPKWLKRNFAYQVANTISVSKNPPFELAPGQKASVLISVQAYRDAEKPPWEDHFFKRKIPFTDKFIPANIHATVSLASGKTVLVKVEQQLVNFLISGEIEGGAARFNGRSPNPATNTQ